MYLNNQNLYGNQYQPNTNMYQQQQQNYNYPQGSIYGQSSNYNQNNYNQNQNQDIGSFISGRIGNKVIKSEDKDTFMKSLQSANWTQNKSYLDASNVHVGMRTSFQSQLKSEIVEPVCQFSRYMVGSNFNDDDYQNYVKFIQEENQRKKEEGEREKNEFLKVNFPNENSNMTEYELFDKIGKNKKDILMKDSNLYGKVERLLLLITSSELPKQSSDIYDYGKPGMGY